MTNAPFSISIPMIRRTVFPILLASLALSACADGGAGTGPDAGLRAAFVTSQPAQARGLGGAVVRPILTVGDSLPGGGGVWAPKPDGLGGYLEDGRLVLFANHELSSAGVKTTDGGTLFPYARVSRLVLDPATLSVVSGGYVVDGSEGYQKLCSATWADASVGMPGGWLLSGEESWGSGKDGIQLAIGRDGRVVEMPWLGRFAHENLVALPGFPGKVVLVGLDDRTGLSELYLYVAAGEADVIAGRGTLHVFRTGQAPNPGALVPGSAVWGRFVPVPRADTLSSAGLQARVQELGAFPFVRLEDGDYDRRPATTRPSLYFVDSGSDRVPDRAAPWDPYGSIYRLELDPAAPTQNVKLQLLRRSAGPAAGWASPDNVATSLNSLMVQEDPAHPAWARPPRIWRFPFGTGGRVSAYPTAVVELENPGCGPTSGSCWESSGIVDASAWMGEGSWLFDVMAASLPVPSLGLAGDNGQLLYLNVPGS
jgi:Bacterial protein of unknown function (DUF839)